MRNLKTIITLLFVLAVAGCTSDSIDQKVNDLYQRMSQEERIAQLRGMMMQDLFDENGKLDTARCGN